MKALIFKALRGAKVRYQQSYPQILGMSDNNVTNQALTLLSASAFEE